MPAKAHKPKLFIRQHNPPNLLESLTVFVRKANLLPQKVEQTRAAFAKLTIN